MLFVLLAVSLFTFLLTSLLPGDPAEALLGYSATDEAVAEIRADLQLDRPLPARFVSWLADAVTGDLGRSYINRRPVNEALKATLPVSLLLMLYAQLLSLVVAIPLGVAAAFREGGWIDRLVTTLTFASISIPNFVVAVTLVFVFSLTLGWFDPTGYVPLTESVGGNVRSLFLPSLTLALGQFAIYARVLRTDMVATLREDFITMARAKGMPTRAILFRHALRPSSFTLLTVAGLNFASLISGAVIVEVIFNLPGLGRITVGAVQNRDYVLVQGCVLVIAVGFVLVNFLTDVLYGTLDPRVRREGRIG